MANIYRYKRNMVYYYEVTANSLKEAEKALDKVWAGNYKNMELSDYVLVKTIKIEPPAPTALDKGSPVSDPVPEEQKLPKPAKKAAKKATKKPAAKTAKKKPAKKTTKRK